MCLVGGRKGGRGKSPPGPPKSIHPKVEGPVKGGLISLGFDWKIQLVPGPIWLTVDMRT